MYEQDLVKIIQPVKKTTISRLNKSKKWEYGYNKEHDIIVISRTGQIGEILQVQNLQIALPKVPKNVYLHPKNKWVRFEQPKDLERLKNAAATKKLAIFDAFEILNRIQEEENLLEGKTPEEAKKKVFKGFAEGRSK